jgi:hypothetical protein
LYGEPLDDQGEGNVFEVDIVGLGTWWKALTDLNDFPDYILLASPTRR